MPLPSPRGKEKLDNWKDRCMGDSIMKREFPDGKKRYAVCMSQWRQAKEQLMKLKEIAKFLRAWSIHEGAVSYQNLVLADMGKSWDATAAEKRVRKWAGGPKKENIGWEKYRKAFLWYNSDSPNLLGSYKLPIADVVGGSLKAVPRGIYAAGGVMRGARGGVDVPSGDKSKIKSHLEKYYHKMDKKAPWEEEIRIAGVPVFEQFFSLRQKLNDTIRDMYGKNAYVVDFSDREVIFDTDPETVDWDENGNPQYKRLRYSVKKGTVNLDGEPETVTRVTRYENDASLFVNLTIAEKELREN